MQEKSTVRRRLSVVGAILVGAAFSVSVVLLLQGVSLFTSWSQVYGGRGEYAVDSCEISSTRFSGRVTCRGRLVPLDDPRPISSELIGPRGAFGSELPSRGEIIETYFKPGDTTEAYPLEGRPTELIRVAVGFVPIVFLVGGTGVWLIGWVLTRNAPRPAVDDPYPQPLPPRFGLRPKGAMWALFGAAWWLADFWLVDDLLGTAGFG